MSHEIECEDRVMLSKEQYESIITFYQKSNPKIPFIMQTNHYLDTSSLDLKRRHAVLRMRKIEGESTQLTLKISKEKGSEEVTQILTYNQEQTLLQQSILPPGEIVKILNIFNVSVPSLKLIGTLKTKRLEIPQIDSLIVIDANSFLNIEDYNLEVESSSLDKAKSIILDLCQKFAIEYKNNYLTKSSRLFKLLQ